MLQVKGETSTNKLIILYVFDKMESALSEKILLDICCSSNDWLNYMDCVSLLTKLVDDGFLCSSLNDGELLYTITPDGRESLLNFYIRIPKSLREEITKFINRNIAKFKIKQECKADYYKNKDGTYTVYLKIVAPVQPMLELKYTVPDKKTANNIYKKWEDKAQELYSVIYETLVD